MMDCDIHFERFIKKVEMEPMSGCWLWTGCIKKYPINGVNYGWFRYKGKNYNAHRVSWMLHFGDLTDNKILVLHRCDNPVCVNPSHLFIGSHKDNIDDCISKGRFVTANLSGDRHPMAKLSYDDVEEIRLMLKKGVSQQSIATMFNVSQSNIGFINRGITWTKQVNL